MPGPRGGGPGTGRAQGTGLRRAHRDRRAGDPARQGWPGEMEDYLILGARNPPLAHQALGVDSSIGLLLPCNVVLGTSAGQTIVEALDPQTMVTSPASPHSSRSPTRRPAGCGPHSQRPGEQCPPEQRPAEATQANALAMSGKLTRRTAGACPIRAGGFRCSSRTGGAACRTGSPSSGGRAGRWRRRSARPSPRRRGWYYFPANFRSVTLSGGHQGRNPS